ncbi:ATP-binding cassette domain-containing protein [Streptomyces sp. NPDC059398]|uniref:ATP-binding cassette domain-containing protein n=1 Tax=Streptomyces sp. NPDC059398 TaxID=3346820 RepID=UPI0036913137
MSVPTLPTAVRAERLGHAYRGTWALRDCDFEIPAGRIAALVGPNGAGKSTLLHLAAGLLRPAAGSVRVFGGAPGSQEALDRTSFLAQDKPLYPGFTVADTLRFGRELNRRWNDKAAEAVVRAGGIPLTTRVGSLSQGQRTRVALAVALGKEPELLLLDEPLADLDPLVRHEVMGLLMTEVVDRGVTILLSSHVLSELEEVCDYVLLLQNGGVRLTGDAYDLRDGHTLVTGRADPGAPDGLPAGLDRATVVECTLAGRQVSALLRGPARGLSGGRWEVEHPSLEEVLLAHLRTPAPSAAPAPAPSPRARREVTA